MKRFRFVLIVCIFFFQVQPAIALNPCVCATDATTRLTRCERVPDGFSSCFIDSTGRTSVCTANDPLWAAGCTITDAISKERLCTVKPGQTPSGYISCTTVLGDRQCRMPKAATAPIENCSGNDPCPFAGTSVVSGTSVTAYLSPIVPAGTQCVSESRLCTNGDLKGSFANSSCTVQASSNTTNPNACYCETNAITKKQSCWRVPAGYSYCAKSVFSSLSECYPKKVGVTAYLENCSVSTGGTSIQRPLPMLATKPNKCVINTG